MSGNRRVQRGARAIVVTGLLVAAGVSVVLAVVTGAWVSPAAVVAVLVGVAVARIGQTEVAQTRRDAATERASQARAAGADFTRILREQRGFTAAMTARLAQRDRTVAELTGSVRLAERRADSAESRVEQERRRADEVHERLSALLDEVLTHSPVATADAEVSDLAAIVDLLAWEERVNIAAGQRQPPAAGRLQA